MREISKYRLRLSLLTVCMSSFLTAHAQSAPGARALQRWQHTSWIGRDGAPTGVMAMEQTPDGSYGLARARVCTDLMERPFLA